MFICDNIGSEGHLVDSCRADYLRLSHRVHRKSTYIRTDSHPHIADKDECVFSACSNSAIAMQIRKNRIQSFHILIRKLHQSIPNQLPIPEISPRSTRTLRTSSTSQRDSWKRDVTITILIEIETSQSPASSEKNRSPEAPNPLAEVTCITDELYSCTVAYCVVGHSVK